MKSNTLSDKINDYQMHCAEGMKPCPQDAIINPMDYIEFEHEIRQVAQQRWQPSQSFRAPTNIAFRGMYGQTTLHKGPPEMLPDTVWFCEGGESVEQRMQRGYLSIIDKQLNDIIWEALNE